MRSSLCTSIVHINTLYLCLCNSTLNADGLIIQHGHLLHSLRYRKYYLWYNWLLVWVNSSLTIALPIRRCELLIHFTSLCELLIHYPSLCALLLHYPSLLIRYPSLLIHYHSLCALLIHYHSLCALLQHTVHCVISFCQWYIICLPSSWCYSELCIIGPPPPLEEDDPRVFKCVLILSFLCSSSQAIQGAHRWLHRVWRLCTDHIDACRTSAAMEGETEADLKRNIVSATHRAIKQVFVWELWCTPKGGREAIITVPTYIGACWAVIDPNHVGTMVAYMRYKYLIEERVGDRHGSAKHHLA